MSVMIGQKAPDFELYTDSRRLFKLRDQRGRKVLLLFFPGAFTSVCTDELSQINTELPAYKEAGVEVIGISTDSPFALAEFKKAYQFDFPLLSDHNADVSDMYSVRYNNDFTDMKLDRIARRSVFLLDEEGEVLHAEVLENAGNMPDFGAVKDILEIA